MPGGTVHLHGYHIASPQCHEQLDKYCPTVIAHKVYVSSTHALVAGSVGSPDLVLGP